MGNIPTHHLSGVSDRPQGHPRHLLPILDPTRLHLFHDDFDRFVAADWTITTTESGLGAATEALADEDGGVLLITNDDADDDADFFQLSAETFKFVAGKQLWFASRIKVSDATDSDFVIGLQITDTAPLAVSDGVYFQKDDGDTNLDFHVTKDSTATSGTAIATVADDTYLRLDFHYDGRDYVSVYVDDALVARLAVTNLPDDEVLTVSFGIQNGAAAAKTMSVDYIMVASER